MNCEKCQELLSDLLDGTLTKDNHATLSAHLGECLSCCGLRDELDSMVSFCREQRGEYDSPPNERALWLRIHNIIESERSAASVTTNLNKRGESWWTRLMNRSWELSLPQLSAAIAIIAVAVSLATAFSVHRMNVARQNDPVSAPEMARNTGGGATMQPHANAALLVDARVRQQQLAIESWNQRIELRKARWNPQMRETFERNLSVIDQAIRDSREELLRSPHDEVSEEMLNAALNDKMELLIEFSDQ